MKLLAIILGLSALLFGDQALAQRWEGIGGGGGGGGSVPGWVPSTLPGSTGNIFYNNAGALNATGALTWDGTTLFNAVTHTGGAANIQALNGGTASNAATSATLAANINDGVCTSCVATMQVVGGATPTANLNSGAGITGGIKMAPTAGPVTLQTPTSGNLSLIVGSGGSFIIGGLGSNAETSALCYNTTGGLVAASTTCGTSALRFKQNLEPITPARAAQFFAGLTHGPVGYEWRKSYDGWDGKAHVGLIADDVAKMDPRCGVYEAGQIKNYDERCVIAYLVADRANTAREIAGLKRTIAQLERGRR